MGGLAGIVSCAAVLFAAPVNAGSETVLYSFQGSSTGDGAEPYAVPFMDSKGDLYGTTAYGGFASQGVVYKLHRTKSGAWKETVLYGFTGESDGGYPAGGVVMDSKGNLYGGTEYGGNSNCGGGLGCGVVYELTPGKGGTWTETVLYAFSSNSKQFGGPLASLTLDGKGTLYGTTVFDEDTCGTHGSVFRLKHVHGVWKKHDIHDFCGNDGDAPEYGALTVDSAGNIFGNTAFGGPNVGDGVVFELSPLGHGKWTFTQLHDFNTENGDGGGLTGGVTLDSADNVYAAATGGGPLALGSIFELTQSGGSWTEDTLHVFNGPPDGENPFQNPIFDASGNLWGTTYNGGQTAYCQGCGVIYELIANGGQWSEQVVYSFASLNGGADGYNPLAGLIRDANGNFYGTTTAGGDPNICNFRGCGVVFEFTP